MNFNSDLLQSYFETAKPILDNISKIKDAISEDIKLFEGYLKSINFPENFRYQIDCRNAFDEEECEYLGIEESLLWNCEKKRLFFVKTTYPIIGDGSMWDVYSPHIAIEKPLIETPFEVRKIVCTGNHLGKLLHAIAEKYDVENKLKSYKS